MSAEVLTILNNSKRTLVFGNAGKGTGMDLYPGATCVSAKLYRELFDEQTISGNSLRAHAKQGTLVQVENAVEPIADVAARIRDADSEDTLVRIACTDGRQECRARAAHKRWLLAERDPMAFENRCYFTTVDPRIADEVSPTDVDRGWRCFMSGFKQITTDNFLVGLNTQADEVRRHQTEQSAIAAAVIGLSQPKGK